MKLYITTRFKDSINKIDEIEEFCVAIRNAGFIDYNFVRDVEKFGKKFDNQRDLWLAAKNDIEKCDGLLIDISDLPTGGRIVEAGIAYALNKPVIVTMQNGIDYKQFYDGISDIIIRYDNLGDLTNQLIQYRKNKLH